MSLPVSPDYYSGIFGLHVPVFGGLSAAFRGGAACPSAAFMLPEGMVSERVWGRERSVLFPPLFM